MSEQKKEELTEKPSKKPKKQEPWIKPRHKFWRAVLAPFVSLLCRTMYNMELRPFHEGDERPYLILSNHQTPFDQFYVGLAVKRPVYYVATEDIFSNGFTSRLIKYLVAPIPIKKGTNNDMNVLRISSRVANEGGTIAIFPEGNRSYSGTTESIKPSIVKFIKLLKLPVAFFKIEGGYGTQPRWSDARRKNKVRCGVTGTLEYDEIKSMSQEELAERINRELFQDDTKCGMTFPSEKSAEYLERVMYYCPYCGLSHFESRGRRVSCISCGMTAEYQDDLTYRNSDEPVCEPIKRKEAETSAEASGYTIPAFPYATQLEWYRAQEDFVRQLDLSSYCGEDKPAYEDPADIYKVHVYERKQQLNTGSTKAVIKLFGDHYALHINGETIALPFDEVTCASVLGKNKLNIYHNGEIYQIKGDTRFNPVKYMHFYYRHQIIKGVNNEQFLGL